MTLMNELVLLVASGIAVGSAVASAWFARKNNVRELRQELDLVSEWAEKAIRASRTARMREVRGAARADAENSPPPELKLDAGPQPLPQDPKAIKAALRQRFFPGTRSH